MSNPDNLKYTKDHEWMNPESGAMGVTNHAQEALGDVVFVELPDVGRQVKAGEPVAVVESVKAVSDVYCPVSGTVTEVNDALTQNAELINESPFEQGWIFKIEIAASDELNQLMDVASYNKLIAE